AQNGACVDLDSVIEDDSRIEHRVGMDRARLPDPAPLPDHDARKKCRSIAYLGLLSHVNEGVNGDVRADPRGRGDTGLRMNASPPRLLLPREMVADGDERGDRVIHFDDSQIVLDRWPTVVEV